MFSRNLKVAAIGALFLGLVGAASTHAQMNPARTTYLTFSGAVALPGVELPAGTYIFELPSSTVGDGMVRVASRDRRQIYLTAFTHQIDRPAGAANLRIAFGEAPAGVAPPIRAWFPAGERLGRQFIYDR
jgi:hypothetical protein